MQVASRLLLVWGVVNAYPDQTARSPFYSSMLLAWSITEVIRYSYFVMNLQGEVPVLVTWLRYNTFYVLYPMGITSEVILVWSASQAARTEIAWGFWAILTTYVPGKLSYAAWTIKPLTQ